MEKEEETGRMQRRVSGERKAGGGRKERRKGKEGGT